MVESALTSDQTNEAVSDDSLSVEVLEAFLNLSKQRNDQARTKISE